MTGEVSSADAQGKIGAVIGTIGPTKQALPDLISGDLQVGFNYIPTFVPAVQAGTIRGLAVTSLQRTRDLPDVPTVQEVGFPGFEATGWNALVAPAGTPPEIIDKISREINAGLADPGMKARIAELGDTVFASSRAEFAKVIAEDTDKWGKVIREAGIKAE